MCALASSLFTYNVQEKVCLVECLFSFHIGERVKDVVTDVLRRVAFELSQSGLLELISRPFYWRIYASCYLFRSVWRLSTDPVGRRIAVDVVVSANYL